MSDMSFGENRNKLTMFNNFFFSFFLEILHFMRMWKVRVYPEKPQTL